MNVFDLRDRLVEDYQSYTRSFINIRDKQIKDFVDNILNREGFWPEPLLQLNPTFRSGGTIDELVAQGILQQECAHIFRIDKSDVDHVGKQLLLHEHQREAIVKAQKGKSYVLMSGTGSGKSLAYIVPIINHVLRIGSGGGIKAIIVYPMNALANSQDEELKKFLEKGFPEGQMPVSFARYTGQEKKEKREEIRKNPPDILLTNYIMLELLLTRAEDRELIRGAQGLQFLVFDELHTYRGRQGADVALLIRRCREAFGGHDITCIGTSATMSSNGSSEEQRYEVAKVAQSFFGINFTPSQVIRETLQRATPEVDFSEERVLDTLRTAITSEQKPPSNYEEFREHPLASWIESTFGVRKENGSEKLLRQRPKKLGGECIGGQKNAAEELANQTGTDANKCAQMLKQWLLHGADLHRSESSQFPIFAFRLHQFFTRGDTVWATLESEAQRHLEITKKAAKPSEPNKPLYPLVFCRHCGTAYYRVRVLEDESGTVLLPREDQREEIDNDGADAYLYVSKETSWPRGNTKAQLSRLPENLKFTTAQGIERVRPNARSNIPEPVFVDPEGRLGSEGSGIDAALIYGNFLFCLEPSCGVAYTKSQRSERNKLVTLGVDNRSTATTILAVRTLIALQPGQGPNSEMHKLLSFTDNRQDASLQAGHFNDFVQVALLRSALHKATAQKKMLRHGDLSSAVFEAMKLRFDEYAADPDVRGPARQETHDALRRVIEYFLYRDLERGWRVTAPNLEDCGLLRFEYEGLAGVEGLLSEVALWESGFSIREGRSAQRFVEVPLALRVAPSEIRAEVIRTLLDVLRRSLSIKVDVLDPQKQHDLVERTKPRLLEGIVWYLENESDLSRSIVAFPRSRNKQDGRELFISSYGAYGRYVKRTLVPKIPSNHTLGRIQIDEIIRFLFLALKRYGIVEQVWSGRDNNDPGYQINSDSLRWLPADGKIHPIDCTRLLRAGLIPPETNQYFVDCYRQFVDLRCVLEAREHTAQVASEDREEREERFRTGSLPLLFCSPTMELGIDIAQLNLVNLRNVPPTPANYAQRSGRAGRGGQPALVFTYCAGRSPHDQYFYREPTRMVAGVVAPPRIDFRNRDLIRSHVHAIWMEVAKPDLGKTLKTVLEHNSKEGTFPLLVKDSLLRELRNPIHRAATYRKANILIAGIKNQLQTASWFHEKWLEEVLDQIERKFDSACDRWRSLYRAAIRQRTFHHTIIGDHSRGDIERSHSRRLRAQAESQIHILTEAEGIYEGDFYSYRYFATEGFLPGYNFPRLPLSAYIPGRLQHKKRDEFISRPRFLAISEFGPRALVYHEGARYRVYKVNLDFESDAIESTHDLLTATMKRCPRCGYACLEQGVKNLTEICAQCGAGLDGEARIDHLVQLQNVSLKLVQRITCDEEERQRFGYRLVTAYCFPEVGGKLDRKDAEIVRDGSVLMTLSYGDATDLYRINLGWTNQSRNQPAGFNLDLERGYWSCNQADDEDRADAANTSRMQRVVPYVKDTKNALVIRLKTPRSGHEMAGLQAAFKQAIQQQFQLEPRELSCEPMPTRDDRREILFYESSEGGAGVLRQLAEEPTVLPLIAKRALEICHYDPKSLEDRAADRCGKACYECLLDYGNQLDHKDLDRRLIRDLLAELANAECRAAGGTGSRAERLVALRRRCDSGLERQWLDALDKFGLRLPSEAQYQIPNYYTQPDFYYIESNTAIYVDGPPHDESDQMHRDKETTRALMEMGYIVLRFHHQDDWAAIFRKHPDIFGVPNK